jgi:serine/threonine protein kinase
MLSHLGKGSFSVVSLAVARENNQRFAIKIYAKIDEMEDYKFDNIYKEISNLQGLQHQNIVNLFHVIKDRRKLLLVMEDGGKLSLAGLLRKSHKIA